MAAGNPVIAHDNEYNRWVAGDAALYFASPGDVDVAVVAVLADAALSATAEQQRPCTIRDEFTWDHVAGEYEALLWTG